MQPGDHVKHTNGDHRGVIVPMVTPVRGDGTLDERAVTRILDYLRLGGVHGVFLLGTTGEGASIPLKMRDRLVQLAVEYAGDSVLVYAGISSEVLGESVKAGNQYLRMGVDAVVAHVPLHFEKKPEEALAFYTDLAHRLDGSLILYNMPLTTNVSLPIELCRRTADRPKVIGIKDSENDMPRMVELLRVLGGKKDFSVFIGTGPLMAKGLLLGAEGIVPSVGNIAPALCRRMYDSAVNGDVQTTEELHAKAMEISAVYQHGRKLAESLAALKAAMSWLGLCGPVTLPPLKPLDEAGSLMVRDKLTALGFPVGNGKHDNNEAGDWAYYGRPRGGRSRALPAGTS